MYAATADECVSRHLWNYREPVWKTPKLETKNYQDFKEEDGTFDCSGTARTQSAMRAIHDVTGPRRTAECWRKDDYRTPHNGSRLRGQAWWDNSENPDMTAFYLERFLNDGL